jgi:hypothetical protein
LDVGDFLQSTGGNRLVILIHGFFTPEQGIIEVTHNAAEWLMSSSPKTQVLSYVWDNETLASQQSPGGGFISRFETCTPDLFRCPSILRDFNAYDRAQEHARDRASESLVTFLRTASAREGPLDLICFSMGCFVLQNTIENGPEAHIRSIVFLAADVAQGDLSRIVKRLAPDTRVAVFSSVNDTTLRYLSTAVNLNTRLGFAGPPAELKNRVISFDCSDGLGAGDAHAKYLSDQKLLEQLAAFLTDTLESSRNQPCIPNK